MKKIIDFIGTLEAFWEFRYTKKWGEKAGKYTTNRRKNSLILMCLVFLIVAIGFPLFDYFRPNKLATKIIIASILVVLFLLYNYFLETEVKKTKTNRLESNFFETENNFQVWHKKSKLTTLSYFGFIIVIPLTYALLKYVTFTLF